MIFNYQILTTLGLLSLYCVSFWNLLFANWIFHLNRQCLLLFFLPLFFVPLYFPSNHLFFLLPTLQTILTISTLLLLQKLLFIKSHCYSPVNQFSKKVTFTHFFHLNQYPLCFPLWNFLDFITFLRYQISCLYLNPSYFSFIVSSLNPHPRTLFSYYAC